METKMFIERVYTTDHVGNSDDFINVYNLYHIEDEINEIDNHGFSTTIRFIDKYKLYSPTIVRFIYVHAFVYIQGHQKLLTIKDEKLIIKIKKLMCSFINKDSFIYSIDYKVNSISYHKKHRSTHENQ